MIHLYTGDGKGKTTAAVGMAIRASKDSKVLFLQLIKNGESAEVETLKAIPNIDYKAFGSGKWVLNAKDAAMERDEAKKALEEVRKSRSGYGIIILDEAVTAIDLGILKEDEIFDLLKDVPKDKEVVLTGRGATKKLIERADLVTEMKKVKHYYDKNIKARKGIEL